MIVFQYEVYDLLSPQVVLQLLLGEMPAKMTLYARKGTEGLLEDFLTEKKFAFYEPIEVEVPDDFNTFCITATHSIKEIDLANSAGRIIILSKPLEPSEN